MPFLKLLARVWLAVVIVMVIAVGGYAVARLRGSAFSSDMHPSYTDSGVADTAAASPKQMVYEVFGSAGTVADISYMDMDSQPQQVEGASLPWSLTLTSDSPAVVGSIVAQGDSDSIGCRILVSGEVKVEKISNQVSAFTHCLVTGA